MVARRVAPEAEMTMKVLIAYDGSADAARASPVLSPGGGTTVSATFAVARRHRESDRSASRLASRG